MNSENIPWSDYPRPQLKREIFKILNGEWKLNDNRIIVPFPPQSELSEYEGEIRLPCLQLQNGRIVIAEVIIGPLPQVGVGLGDHIHPVLRHGILPGCARPLHFCRIDLHAHPSVF